MNCLLYECWQRDHCLFSIQEVSYSCSE